MTLVADVLLFVAGVGLVMVLAALLSRSTKRLLGLTDQTVNSPRFRRSDTSGLSLAIHWLKPGLVVMFVAGSLAILVQLLD